MIDTLSLMLALRARLATLSVASCSGVNLGASGYAFTRSSGSFITDGFSVGMEVTPSGFASSTPCVVTGVTASTLTTDTALTTETSASGRTLTVGLPSRCAWENIAFEPTTGTPWLEEQYIPGPSRQMTVGPLGLLELRPLYSLRIHTPEDVGVGAAVRYADALLELFTPRTAISFGSEVARVRTDTGPYRGQLLNLQPGYATVPVTFPLEIRVANTI